MPNKTETFAIALAAAALVGGCSGRGGRGGGGSSPDGPSPEQVDDVDPSETCDAYLACLGATQPTQFAKQAVLYGDDGSCWEAGDAFADTCGSACSAAHDLLWADHMLEEACWRPWPAATVPEEHRGDRFAEGEYAPVFGGVDQYGRPLSLGAFFGRPLVVALVWDDGYEPNYWDDELPSDRAHAVWRDFAEGRSDAPHWLTVPYERSGYPESTYAPVDPMGYALRHSLVTEPVLGLDPVPSELVEAVQDGPVWAPNYIFIDEEWRTRRMLTWAGSSTELEAALEELMLSWEPPSPPAPAVDEVEPNDTFAQAQPLSLSGPAVIRGTLDVCSDQETDTARADVFEVTFDLPSFAALTWELSWSGNADLDLEIYQEDETLLNSAWSSSYAPPEVVTGTPEGGVGFVRVYCWDGDPVEWTLTVTDAL